MDNSSLVATRSVPFLDLVTPHKALAGPILEAIERSLGTARFVGGPEVEGFEQEFSAFTGAAETVGVASGTDALLLAYVALGIRPGDEVITVPNTFIATTEALTQAGATIRFVDVDPRTSNMAPELLEAAIGPRTVGVVPVHLYGQPADMDAIMEVADRHGLWVVEDAAQAQGSLYKSGHTGRHGVMATYSFYAGKNLGACGEAGAITTNDPELAAQLRALREHGQSEKYYHDIEGYNARLDAWQAAVLRIKLPHLAEWNRARRRAADWYFDFLEGVPGIDLPVEPEWATGNWHLFVVHTDARDELREVLAAAGVGTGLHYPLPLHLQNAYAHLGLGEGSFPVSESLATRLLSLPMHPELTEDDVRYVASVIKGHMG